MRDLPCHLSPATIVTLSPALAALPRGANRRARLDSASSKERSRAPATAAIPPGARVLIRDAEWVVKRIDRASAGGWSLQVVGVSELAFYGSEWEQASGRCSMSGSRERRNRRP